MDTDIGLLHNLYLDNSCTASGDFRGLCVPTVSYLCLILKNRISCCVTIIGGVLNGESMYVLLEYTSLGVYAVLLTTAAIMNFINLVTNPIYMARCLKVKKTTFYPSIAKNIASFGVALIGMMLISMLQAWRVSCGSLILEIAVLVIIGVIVQIPVLFGLGSYNKDVYIIKKRG